MTNYEVVKQTAEAMLRHEIHWIEGARRLLQFMDEPDPGDSDAFLAVVSFESQTDHIPFGDQRDRYNDKYLQSLDEEFAEIVELLGPGLMEACRQIAADMDRRIVRLRLER